MIANDIYYRFQLKESVILRLNGHPYTHTHKRLFTDEAEQIILIYD